MDFFETLLNVDFSQVHPADLSPFVLWTNVCGDAAIALAYFVIPFVLYYFVKRRKLSQLNGVFLLFAALTFLCSLTHLLNIVSVWYPVYRLQGFVKVLTGSASLATTFVLIYSMPTLIKIPTIKQMADANEELKHKSDELKTQNEFLRNLAYSTYHDLREPVRGMAINSQALMLKHADDLDDETKGILQHITTESKRMFNSVDSILKLTYMESEKFKFQPVNLQKVIENTKDRLQNLIYDNEAQITCTKDLPVLEGNESLLGILFENVLANSIRFRSETEPVIHISASQHEGQLTLRITDNGSGFDNEYRNQVFEMFKTLGNARYRGAGLGLAMSKRIVEIHNGHISASSAENCGTTITIVLPTEAKQPKQRQIKHFKAA